MIHILWVIYLGIVGTNTIFSILRGEYKTRLAKIDLLFTIVSFIGLFGFITNHIIFTLSFWKVFFVFLIIWEIWYSFIYFRREQGISVMTVPFILLLSLPVYIAVYSIAFN